MRDAAPPKAMLPGSLLSIIRPLTLIKAAAVSTSVSLKQPSTEATFLTRGASASKLHVPLSPISDMINAGGSNEASPCHCIHFVLAQICVKNSRGS